MHYHDILSQFCLKLITLINEAERLLQSFRTELEDKDLRNGASQFAQLKSNLALIARNISDKLYYDESIENLAVTEKTLNEMALILVAWLMINGDLFLSFKDALFVEHEKLIKFFGAFEKQDINADSNHTMIEYLESFFEQVYICIMQIAFYEKIKSHKAEKVDCFIDIMVATNIKINPAVVFSKQANALLDFVSIDENFKKPDREAYLTGLKSVEAWQNFLEWADKLLIPNENKLDETVKTSGKFTNFNEFIEAVFDKRELPSRNTIAAVNYQQLTVSDYYLCEFYKLIDFYNIPQQVFINTAGMLKELATVDPGLAPFLAKNHSNKKVLNHALSYFIKFQQDTKRIGKHFAGLKLNDSEASYQKNIVDHFRWLEKNGVNRHEMMALLAYCHQVPNAKEGAIGIINSAAMVVQGKLQLVDLYPNNAGMIQYLPNPTGGVLYREIAYITEIKSMFTDIVYSGSTEKPLVTYITDCHIQHKVSEGIKINLTRSEANFTQHTPCFLKNFLSEGFHDPSLCAAANPNDFIMFLGVIARLWLDNKFDKQVLKIIVMQLLEQIAQANNNENIIDKPSEVIDPWFFEAGSWFFNNKEAVIKNFDSVLEQFQNSMPAEQPIFIQNTNADEPKIDSWKAKLNEKLSACRDNILSLKLLITNLDQLRVIAEKFLSPKELLIEANARWLVKLDAFMDTELKFPNLVKLTITGFPEIIKIHAPNLEVLDLSGCHQFDLQASCINAKNLKRLILPKSQKINDADLQAMGFTVTDLGENFHKILSLIEPKILFVEYLCESKQYQPIGIAMKFIYTRNAPLFSYLSNNTDELDNPIYWNEHALALFGEDSDDFVCLEQFINNGANPLKQLDYTYCSELLSMTPGKLSAFERAAQKAHTSKLEAFLKMAEQSREKTEKCMGSSDNHSRMHSWFNGENTLNYLMTLYRAFGLSVKQNHNKNIKLLIDEIYLLTSHSQAPYCLKLIQTFCRDSLWLIKLMDAAQADILALKKEFIAEESYIKIQPAEHLLYILTIYSAGCWLVNIDAIETINILLATALSPHEKNDLLENMIEYSAKLNKPTMVSFLEKLKSKLVTADVKGNNLSTKPSTPFWLNLRGNSNDALTGVLAPTFGCSNK